MSFTPAVAPGMEAGDSRQIARRVSKSYLFSLVDSQKRRVHWDRNGLLFLLLQGNGAAIPVRWMGLRRR